MRAVTFQKAAFDEFTAWATEDPKVFERLTRLVCESARALRRHRQTGTAATQSEGHWSRRLTDEHRLVYRVTETTLTIVSCRFHY